MCACVANCIIQLTFRRRCDFSLLPCLKELPKLEAQHAYLTALETGDQAALRDINIRYQTPLLAGKRVQQTRQKACYGERVGRVI